MECITMNIYHLESVSTGCAYCESTRKAAPSVNIVIRHTKVNAVKVLLS